MRGSTISPKLLDLLVQVLKSTTIVQIFQCSQFQGFILAQAFRERSAAVSSFPSRQDNQTIIAEVAVTVRAVMVVHRKKSPKFGERESFEALPGDVSVGGVGAGVVVVFAVAVALFLG
jgi:hypothetical protein